MLLRLSARYGRCFTARDVGISALGANRVLYDDILVNDLLALALRLCLIAVDVLVLVTAHGSLRAALAYLRRAFERNAGVVRFILILAVLTSLALAAVLLRLYFVKTLLQIVDAVFEIADLSVENIRFCLLVLLFVLVAFLFKTADSITEIALRADRVPAVRFAAKRNAAREITALTTLSDCRCRHNNTPL